MAKLVEEKIIITLSRLVKDDTKTSTIIDSELISTLETVAAELVGEGVVVEGHREPE
jgi:hypothetical protein